MFNFAPSIFPTDRFSTFFHDFKSYIYKLDHPPHLKRIFMKIKIAFLLTILSTVMVSAQTSSTPLPKEGQAHTPLHRFALATNFLYDAVLMPNLELQWRVNSRWSLSMEGNVAWWDKASRHKYYQIAMISPEIRYWMRPRGVWHGIYAGAFTGGGWYDLENGKTGYRGEGGLAGISFGVMWHIGNSLSLDAEVGAGYMYSRYKEYIPYDDHYLYQRTKSLNYFGPLKIKFSIAWRFYDINKSRK